MRAFQATLLCLGTVFVVSGCESLDSMSTLGSGQQSLAVPPDLTTPQTETTHRLPNAARQRAGPSDLKAFGEFRDFQKRAEYAEFLKWREEHGIAQAFDFSAFRAAQREAQRSLLRQRGVVTAKDDTGQHLVLLDDTLDNSWSRIDTAVLNMGLKTLDINRATKTFRIHYDTRKPAGEPEGLAWLYFWLREPVIYKLRLHVRDEIIIAGVFDDDDVALTDQSANAFIARLAVQLRTFARDREQHVVGGRKGLPGLSLRETATGRLQLALPEGPVNAWKRVEKTLDNIGFSVFDKNENKLHFFIRYADREAPDSTPLIEKFAFWKKDPITPASTFRLQLSPAGSTSVLNVINAEGNLTETGDRILSLIFERLKN
jgi:uncharacterized lipoprotein